MPDKSACRLYVILARESSIALIFRRGPSRRVQLIRWDTANDTFEPGQWFKGRIYEERCDLSPSGDKLIYFAAKHYLRRAEDAFPTTWTAISRIPYLTALAVWTNRNGTYFGGGLFASEDRIQLDAHDLSYFGRLPEPLPDYPVPIGLQIESFPLPYRDFQNFALNPEYLRLLRDGWTWHEDGLQPTSWRQLAERSYREFPMPRNLFRRGSAAASREIVLHRQLTYGGDSYYLHHGALSSARDEWLDDVGWADFDRRGRLLCASRGKLFEVEPVVRSGAREWRGIADFNANHPYSMVAPDSAKVW